MGWGSKEDVVDGPPSRRANATLTACPVKEHLYLFGVSCPRSMLLEIIAKISFLQGEYFDGSTV